MATKVTKWQTASGGLFDSQSEAEAQEHQEAADKLVQEKSDVWTQMAHQWMQHQRLTDAPELVRLNAQRVDELVAKFGPETAQIAAPTTGVELIAQERTKQLAQWSAEHDAQHVRGGLLDAAHDLLVLPYKPTSDWGLCKKYEGDRRKQLVVAGALIAAELDRRAAATFAVDLQVPREGRRMNFMQMSDAEWRAKMGHVKGEVEYTVKHQGASVYCAHAIVSVGPDYIGVGQCPAAAMAACAAHFSSNYADGAKVVVGIIQD